MPDYVLYGSKWPTTTITWSLARSGATKLIGDNQIAPGTAYLPSTTYKAAIQLALEVWSSISNLTFVEATDSTNVDLRFDLDSPPLGTAGITQLARSSQGLYQPFAKVSIGASLPAVPDPKRSSTYPTIFSVALHEVGHALGLDHNADHNSLMFPSGSDSARGFDDLDVAAIAALYGQHKGSGTVSISDAVGSEGNVAYGSFTLKADGTGDLVPLSALKFAVIRSDGAGYASVFYSTPGHPGYRTPTSNVLGVSGVVVFAPGETTQNISVPLDGDYLYRENESFSVVLSSPSTGLTVAKQVGVGTVLNDDMPSQPIFRFFDTKHGTQFLTSNSVEKDGLIATRSDLIFEGESLMGINPANNDPAAAPVYRFFDSVYGTHFLTASTIERDTVTNTRSDLVFEGVGFTAATFASASLSSTHYAPVYRFFDSNNGTHFFTGSATERGSILTLRPDFKDEGIGFYTSLT